MGEKPLCIKFNEVDGLIKSYDGIRYLVLFSYFHYEICNRIKYLKSEKRSIIDTINYIFAKIRIDSYNPLAIKKVLTFHNVIILIKSVVNENKNK